MCAPLASKNGPPRKPVLQHRLVNVSKNAVGLRPATRSRQNGIDVSLHKTQSQRKAKGKRRPSAILLALCPRTSNHPKHSPSPASTKASVMITSTISRPKPTHVTNNLNPRMSLRSTYLRTRGASGTTQRRSVLPTLLFCLQLFKEVSKSSSTAGAEAASQQVTVPSANSTSPKTVLSWQRPRFLEERGRNKPPST